MGVYKCTQIRNKYENSIIRPLIQITNSDTNLPFDFERTQFQIRAVFCVTINNSQGQTLEFVSIWLGDDYVLTHRQLNEALSRVSDLLKIKIATNNPKKLTRIVVFKKIFR